MTPSTKYRKMLAANGIKEVGYANEVLTALTLYESTLSHIAAGRCTNPNVAAQEALERLVSDPHAISQEHYTAAQQAVRIVGHVEERFRPFCTEGERADARQMIEDILLGKVNLS